MLEKDSIYSPAMIQTMEIGSNHNQRKRIVILCKSLSLKLKIRRCEFWPWWAFSTCPKAVKFDGIGEVSGGVCVYVSIQLLTFFPEWGGKSEYHSPSC